MICHQVGHHFVSLRDMPFEVFFSEIEGYVPQSNDVIVGSEDAHVEGLCDGTLFDAHN